MMRISIFIWSLMCSTLYGYSQAEFLDDFNDNELAAYWKVTGTTFSLLEEEGVLKVTYIRTGTAGTQWDQFHLDGISVNVDEHRYIALDLRSDVAFQLALKPVSTAGDDWLTQDVPGDNAWHTYVLEVANVVGQPVVNLYIYFDGGSSVPRMGNILLDNVMIGYHYTAPVITTLLSAAISDANNLAAYIHEGTDQGTFPAGSREKLIAGISAAQAVLNNSELATQSAIDMATEQLYDVMTNVEKSVVLSDKGLIDMSATKETVFLYKNLQYLSAGSKYLFGMHDATAYGINQGGSSWYDDGSATKSDVKQITGSHPAVFSQDVYDIIEYEPTTLTNYRHRQTKAYQEGGVITLVWHMDDPVNKTFYWDQLSPSYNVVASLLPGGMHHEWYKANLEKLAFYIKGLRSENGTSIPVIFRPFHEHNGAWFWWGRTRCTTAEYNAIWKFTIEYLRDERNVHSFIYAFSPDGNQYNTKSEYLNIYPGDDFVDVFGIDYYFGEGTPAARDKLRDRLVHIVEYADERDKLAALTEFGDRLDWDDDDKIEITNFYTAMVLSAVQASLKSKRIAYLATWRNDNPQHHFAPYPGHKEVANFIQFFDDPATLFLNDLPALYTSRLDQVTSIGDRLESQMYVYPNPVHDVLFIEAPVFVAHVTLTSATGQQILEVFPVQSRQVTLDFRTLPKGIYLLGVILEHSKERRVIQKIIRN